MSLSPMSHAEFKKWLCRPDEFRGQGLSSPSSETMLIKINVCNGSASINEQIMRIIHSSQRDGDYPSRLGLVICILESQ